MTASFDPIKAGETFSFYLDAALDDVPDPTLTSSDVVSQVRGRDGQLLTSLTVSNVAGTPGRVLLSAVPAETAKWPVGFVFCDVKWTRSGVVMLTDTLKIPVERAQTQ